MQQSRYHQVYAQWQNDPEGFWRDAASSLDWIKAPTNIFDKSAGIYGRWFADGVCNTSQNCLDRHVAAGRGDQCPQDGVGALPLKSTLHLPGRCTP